MVLDALARAGRAAAVLALAVGTAPAVRAVEPPLAIEHVTVIDTRNGAVRPDRTVVIAGHRIHAVGDSATLKVPADAVRVAGQGKFLIPGLWDMHVHTIFGDWLPEDPDLSLPLFIANGVTGVRDMGGGTRCTETLARGDRGRTAARAAHGDRRPHA